MPPVKATKPVKTLECKKKKHDYVFQENNFLKNVSGADLQCWLFLVHMSVMECLLAPTCALQLSQRTML